MEVGAITLTVDYWSTLSMDLWTASSNKPKQTAVDTLTIAIASE